MRAARVHHAARRRGGAGRSRRARSRPTDAARWRAHRALAADGSGSAGPHRGVRRGAAAIGLDRRPQRADRAALGRGRCRRIRKYAAELVALAPDVILAAGSPTVGALLQATRTVPIVFATSRRSGRRRLRRQPGAAGRQRHRLHAVRIQLGRKMAGAAQADRAGHDASGGASGSALTAGIGQFAVIQSAAPSLGVEVSPVNVRDVGEIERGVAAFARAPNGGLIVTASALAIVHRDPIVALAARHKLPAVYPYRYFVAAGGLISYGPISSTSPARGRLRRSHPQGREAGRPAGAGSRPSTSW